MLVLTTGSLSIAPGLVAAPSLLEELVLATAPLLLLAPVSPPPPPHPTKAAQNATANQPARCRGRWRNQDSMDTGGGVTGELDRCLFLLYDMVIPWGLFCISVVYRQAVQIFKRCYASNQPRLSAILHIEHHRKTVNWGQVPMNSRLLHGNTR